MTMTFERFAEFIADETGAPPVTVWAICDGCRGDGATSAHLGAFTESDMDELGDDFRDDYMRGVYDVPCDECGGSGKVRALPEGSEHEAAWDEWCAEEAADRATMRAECGLW